VDGNKVPTDGNRNLTSVSGSNTGETEHQLHLGNNRISHCLNDVTEAASLFSSRQSALSDDKMDDFTPNANEPTGNQAVVKRRKRGWPKGVPRKKQVIQFLRR